MPSINEPMYNGCTNIHNEQMSQFQADNPSFRITCSALAVSEIWSFSFYSALVSELPLLVVDEWLHLPVYWILELSPAFTDKCQSKYRCWPCVYTALHSMPLCCALYVSIYGFIAKHFCQRYYNFKFFFSVRSFVGFDILCICVSIAIVVWSAIVTLLVLLLSSSSTPSSSSLLVPLVAAAIFFFALSSFLMPNFR